MSQSAISETRIYLYDGSKTSWTFKDSEGTVLATISSMGSYFPIFELPLTATNAAGTQTITFLESSVPTGYAESDYNCMLLFLEQTDEDGVKNGKKINTYYSPNKPATWTGVTWTQINGVKHATRIDWQNKGLSGLLNLSGCTALETLTCTGSNITSLDVSENTALWGLMYAGNQLTTLDVSNNTELEYLYCWNSDLQTVVMSPSAIRKTKIYLFDYGYNTTWTFKNSEGTKVGIVANGNSYYTVSELPLTATNATGTQTIAFLEPGTTIPLSVPTISAESNGTNALLVTIGAVANASGYSLQYATNPDFTFATTETYTESGTKRISGLNADTTYYFRVKATGTGVYSESDYSSTVSAKTDSLYLSNLAISSSAPIVGTTISTTLTPAEATATYQWYRGTDPDNIATAIPGAMSASYTPTSSDLGYYLKVTATGYGNYFGTVSVSSTTIVQFNSDLCIDVVVVPTLSVTQSDTADLLPVGVASAQPYSTIYAEIWMKNLDGSNQGIISGTIDLNFDKNAIQANSLHHTGIYTQFPGGEVSENGLIDDFCGGSLDKTYGVTQWVRLGYVSFTTLKLGDVSLELSHGKEEFTRFGKVPWDNVRLNPASFTVECMYDLDKDDKIDFGDFSYFANAFGTRRGEDDPNWNARCDFDGSGQIDFGDFSYFATAFGKAADDPTIVYPNIAASNAVAAAQFAQVPEELLGSLFHADSDMQSSLNTTEPEIVVVPVVTPIVSETEMRSDQPESKPAVLKDEPFFVELWMTTNTDVNESGISGGCVDIKYDTTQIEVTELKHGNLYNNFPKGTNDFPNGLIDDFGGGTLKKNGESGNWVRLGYVEMTGKNIGDTEIALSGGDMPFARHGRGNIDFDKVDLQSVSFPIVEQPKVELTQEKFQVQEGCSLLFNLSDENLTCYWDISGTGDGEFVPMNLLPPTARDISSNGNTIRVRVVDSYGFESDPVEITVATVQTPPCFTARQTLLLNDQVMKLELNATCYGGRAIKQWVITWGDDSQPTTVNCLQNNLTVAHYYGSQTNNVPITVTLTETDGSTSTFVVGQYTRSAAANNIASSSADSSETNVVSEVQPCITVIDSMEFIERDVLPVSSMNNNPLIRLDIDTEVTSSLRYYNTRTSRDTASTASPATVQASDRFDTNSFGDYSLTLPIAVPVESPLLDDSDIWSDILQDDYDFINDETIDRYGHEWTNPLEFEWELK